MSRSQYCVEKFLDKAGVDRRTFSAKPSFYRGFNNLFTLGWGKDYINGNFEIEDEDLIAMFTNIFKAFNGSLQGDDYAGFRSLRFHKLYQLMNATQRFNWQFIRSRYFADKHYELPPELFEGILGKYMAYSSGYWTEGITTLDEAQDAKFNLIIRKLGLGAGDTVLDFGCGFGSFGQYAGKLGIRYVGLNICKQHLKYAHSHNDYPDLVKYLYFNLVTQSVAELRSILKAYGIKDFDAVTFIGSIEHVGWKNYLSLYHKLYQLLNPTGRILCHVIGSHIPVPVADPFIMTEIFPDSQLAVISEMTRATQKARFKLLDWHDLEMGNRSYAKTLRAWSHNLKDNWETIKPFMPHTDKAAFYRKWVFYPTLCTGAFESDFTNVGHYHLGKIGDNRPFTVVR